MEAITLKPIGIIHTPFREVNNMPIQPIAAEGVKGYIELLPEYIQGLKDVEGFSHLTLLYFFHLVNGFDLEVVPFMDKVKHGIFSCRAPKRPNHIGISTVKLISVRENILYIEQPDMVDGTPLLDIKPFYPRFDNRDEVRIGWLENNKDLPIVKLKADTRFCE